MPIKMYICKYPTCTNDSFSRAKMAKHEETCPCNPAMKSCYTCIYGQIRKCVYEDSFVYPTIHCSHWKLKEACCDFYGRTTYGGLNDDSNALKKDIK